MNIAIAVTSLSALLVLGSVPTADSWARPPSRALHTRSTVWSTRTRQRLRRPARRGARPGRTIRRWGHPLFRGRLKQRARRARRIAPARVLDALRRRVHATWARMLARGQTLSPSARAELARMNERVGNLLRRLQPPAGPQRKSILRELRRLSDRAKVLMRTRKAKPRAPRRR